jgi:excinuclease ABC subunit C
MTNSALDGIPGLGDVKRKALLRQFGSVKRIRAATTEELVEVQGIGRALADVIQRELTGETAEPSVNLMTGEIVDEHRESND